MDKLKVDKTCSVHLLLLCKVLTRVSYIRIESLLDPCAEGTPLGAKVQCHATQQRRVDSLKRLEAT